jgi:hypothetical protein
MVYNSSVVLKDLVLDSDVENKIEDKNEINLNLPQTNFKAIDRDAEDALVSKYQKTKNMATLTKLYEIRQQTLKIWAKKYAYLRMSEEDLLSDITMIWQKCVDHYEYKPKKRIVKTKSGKLVLGSNGKRKTIFKRTPFNTFLYTSLRHYMSNISKRQHSKKRVDNKGRPQELNLMSLDYEYNTNKSDSKKVCLKDTLVSQEPCTRSKYATDTMIEDISKGDNDVRDALIRFVSDPHVKKISNACQNVVEQINVCVNDAEIFKGHKGTAKKRLKNIIDESNKYSRGYKLLNFRFDDKSNVITFEVKRKDTKILRKTVKALKRYRQKLETKTN